MEVATIEQAKENLSPDLQVRFQPAKELSIEAGFDTQTMTSKQHLMKDRNDCKLIAGEEQ